MSSTVGVHDFAIPHEHVIPTRDMAIIQLPHPPRKSPAGTIIIPDIFRDMAKHNVVLGRVVSMGPLAFWYQAGDGKMQRHDVNVGDWVTIRPFAGTHVQGGKLQVGGGFRYVSTFQDVIGILPREHAPDPDKLLWTEEDEPDAPAATPTEFGGGAREVIKVKPNG